MLKEFRINDKGEQIEYDKAQVAIDRIKFAYEVSEARGLGALYVAFSGGKDSGALAELVEMSGVPYTLNYNMVGIDPPELIYFMREKYNAMNPITDKPIYPHKYDKNKINLYWHKYEKSMWRLIVERRMPPTRKVRYCCKELKEHGGEGKVCLTGVRWAESIKRKNNRRAFESITPKITEKMLFNDNEGGRKQFEVCQLKGKLVVNPIIDWTDKDVWDFHKERELKYCKKYDEGFHRLGCIGCPQGNKKGMLGDFKCYPKFKRLYLLAFEKMVKSGTYKKDRTAEEVFEWWVNGKSDIDENQLNFLNEVEE